MDILNNAVFDGAVLINDLQASTGFEFLTYDTTSKAVSKRTLGSIITKNVNDYVPYSGAIANVDLDTFSLTANAIIKKGGLSTQFLKADGSIDSNTYALSSALGSYLPLTGGKMTGTIDSDHPSFPLLTRSMQGGNVGGFSRDVFRLLGTNGIADMIGHYGTVDASGNITLIYGYLGGTAYNAVSAMKWTPDGRVSIGSSTVPSVNYTFDVNGSSLSRGSVNAWGIFNSSSGELQMQRLGATRIRTNTNSLILSGDTSNGLVYIRPQGDAVSGAQVYFGADSSMQFVDNYNLKFGTQTSVGSSIFHTNLANNIFGYGIWLNHNLQFNGTDFIQPRGSLNSLALTVNNHKSFSFNIAAASGTSGSAVTLTELVRITTSGQINTLNHGDSSQWISAYNNGFTYKSTIGANVDLNTMTTSGWFVQGANVNVSTTLNYPVNSLAGQLRVYGVSTTHLVQEYIIYTTGVTYRRYYYNGTWYAWLKVWDTRDFSQTDVDTWKEVGNYPKFNTWVANAMTTKRLTVRELGWSGYGNNHTILDISSGITPLGQNKSKKDAEIAWTDGYPTLVGFNGNLTYGLRVDSARTADSIGDDSAIRKRNNFLGNGSGLTLDDAKTEHGFVYADGSGLFGINGPYIAFGRLGNGDDYQAQMAIDYNTGGGIFKYRTRNGDAGQWNLPRTVVNQEDNQDISGIKNFTHTEGVWSTRYKFGTGSFGPAGKVTKESSFFTLGIWGNNVEFGYGISTNSGGGLDIMANQGGQSIRFWAGTDNTNPSQVARFYADMSSFYSHLSIDNGREFRLKGPDDSAHVIKHFSDDVDGFQISTGFAVRNYANGQNLFNVDNGGSAYTASHMVINNLASGNGVGLHLYPGTATNGSPRYGIHVSQTSIFGKHGDVQSDFAEYFTMGGGVQRGWMFRDDTNGNVASISGRGRMTVNGSYSIPGYNTDYLLTSGGVRNASDFDCSSFTSRRDFANGTLIKTNISATAPATPFLLEIKANVFGNGTVPLFLLLQGYVYFGSPGVIYAPSAFTTAAITGGIKIYNVGGMMCFWFARQGYWNGYDVKLTVVIPNDASNPVNVNRVVDISDSAEPSSGLMNTINPKRFTTEDEVATQAWAEGRYIQKWENALAVGFNQGNVNSSPYIYHTNGTYVQLATQSWVNSNFALRDGSNSTDTWVNASRGLTINPSIPGKIMNASGNSDLASATYGSVMGLLNSAGTAAGNPTGDWYHRIKMLHSNSAGYYTEIAVQMTTSSTFWFRRFDAGNPTDWVQALDTVNSFEITGKKAFLTTGPVFSSAALEARSNMASWKPSIAFWWTPGNLAAQIKFDGAGFELMERNGAGYTYLRSSMVIAGDCLIGTHIVGDEAGLIGANDDYIAVVDYSAGRYTFGTQSGINIDLNSYEVGIGPGGVQSGWRLHVDGSQRTKGKIFAQDGFIHQQYNSASVLLTSDGGGTDIKKITAAPTIWSVAGSGTYNIIATTPFIVVYGNGGSTTNLMLPDPSTNIGQTIKIMKTNTAGVFAIYKNGSLMFNMMGQVAWEFFSTGGNYIFKNENGFCQVV